MKKIMKVTLIVIVVLIAIGALGYGFYDANREKYASEDPLNGTYVITKDGIAEPKIGDFIVSINVYTSDKKMDECAKKSKVDITKGCWAYCFDENKVFRVKKSEKKASILENEKEIGEIRYEGRNYLIVDKRKYFIKWRGKEFTLRKTSQGFFFP